MGRAFFVVLLLCGGLFAESYQVVMDGPIHEAFFVRESGSWLLEAIPNTPPSKITELPSRQKDPQAIWIPGYWSWSFQHSVFLWTSGVWRKPPPGMQWINGYWKNYPQGWVWIGGFWSAIDQENLTYLKTSPPDVIDERIGLPPHTSLGQYIWIPGNWQFDTQLRHYVWYSGRWELMDAHWVFCPSHYIWRELGYVFVPGFWDWPIQTRGEIFPAIYVQGEALTTITYEPKQNLDPLYVMELMFPYWPDYMICYLYHYHNNYNAWATWGAAPPWWNWPSWTGYPRTAQWALWWWWTHPGYPHPAWITPQLAQLFPAPPHFVTEMMQKVRSPAIVTPSGVVEGSQLFQALTQASGSKLPILPSNPKQIGQIQEVAFPPQKSMEAALVPRGQKGLHPDEKPFIGPSTASLRDPPRRIILPKRPMIYEEPAQTPQHKKVPKPSYSYQQPPTHRYIEYPYQQPTQRPYQQPFKAPTQGYQMEYTYPQAPMQTLHQNRIMGSPQFQENPAGPKVHPVPGDYSTLPGQ